VPCPKTTKVKTLVVFLLLKAIFQLKSHSTKSKKGAEAPFGVQTNLTLIKLLLVYDV
jgi:hypothetical protein